ncbi:MAG: YicC/YloC family endoribonuclease [Porphyromonas sp.]|nr:YicC/YloC family endoribonuclease [Porphyromonas sp.]
MLQSMTGFGKGTNQNNGVKITVEIRTLNSKQLDLSVRMPNLLREFEIELRKEVAAQVVRGKVEVAVSLEGQAKKGSATLNKDVILQYWEELSSLCQETGMPYPLDVTASIMRLPDSIAVNNETSPEDTASYRDSLFEALALAIEALQAFRTQEGEMLANVLRGNIENIRNHYQGISLYEEQRIADIRARLTESLEKLPNVSYDAGRLEQELIYYIEKLDITEEKKRLENHLDYFLKTIDEPAAGKKLGFIAQEIGREINTMGSKSNQAEMQQIVVKMKDELEQIKEQVLNVL